MPSSTIDARPATPKQATPAPTHPAPRIRSHAVAAAGRPPVVQVRPAFAPPEIRVAPASTHATHAARTAHAVSYGGSSFPLDPADLLRAAGAAAAAGSQSGSGLFFLAFALLLVAASRASRVVRLPAARGPRPAFSLLLEHPG
jgi:hypothetical protein